MTKQIRYFAYHATTDNRIVGIEVYTDKTTSKVDGAEWPNTSKGAKLAGKWTYEHNLTLVS